MLYPLAVVWAGVACARRRFLSGRAEAATIPTLVVGNLHSGGSGKTPLVAAIAEHYRPRLPAIISRGYRGSKSKEGTRVFDDGFGPESFGDEPWMLFRALGLPVFIGARRARAIAQAAQAGAGLAVLDDGFQNFSFAHHTDIIALSADRPTSEYCLPLGDLREGFGALRAAHAVVLTGTTGAEPWREFLQSHFPHLRVFQAETRVEGIWGAEGRVENLGDLGWGAFCGIANAGRFGVAARQWVQAQFVEVFADHHRYTEEDIQSLLKLKNRSQVHHLLTTEKDWHKVAARFQEAQQSLFYLKVRYHLDASFWNFLDACLGAA